MFIDIFAIVCALMACIAAIIMWTMNNKCKQGMSKSDKDSMQIVGAIISVLGLFAGGLVFHRMAFKGMKLKFVDPKTFV
jgi:hypothetical protein